MTRGLGGEHGDQLLDDYDLAGLWRRDHASLPHPTAWSSLAEFPGRRGRLGRGDRLHPRPRAGTFGHPGQLLGGPGPSVALGSFAGSRWWAASSLVWQGVPLNLAPYTEVHTLEGGVQTIAQGPVAALEFIKNLGTNGGGFFNANGAHPYENPTPLVNFLGLLAIAVLPASLTITFGHMTGSPRAGWVLLAVMVVLFVGGLAVCDFAEAATPPQFANLHVAGGNMEGKETRFGIGGSVLAAVVTSNGATGSYNSMHDSYQPLGVLVPLVNMLLGEVVFGGLGTGLYSMVMIALIAVFLGGLMIGRTPEYLGKKITSAETRLAVLYALLTPKVVLVLTAVAIADGCRPGWIGHQQRDTRLHRSAIRLRLGDGQQWTDHGRPQRQQRVLQCDHGHRHAGWTIRHGRAGVGPGWAVRSPAARANDRGDAAQRFRPVRHVGARHDRPGGRARLPARPGARPDRRGFAALSFGRGLAACPRRKLPQLRSNAQVMPVTARRGGLTSAW